MSISQLNNGDSGLTARTIINNLVDTVNTSAVTSSISASLATTASYAVSSSVSNNTISSSYALTASFSNSSISSSYALTATTASYAVSSSVSNNTISSSYALTASFALNGGGGGSINTSSLATTGSNTFTSNQNILDNYLYITSSTTPRFAELGNEAIVFYDDASNTGDRYSYVGFDGISLLSGSYNRLDIAVNANTFGSSWAGSVFRVRNNLNNPVDVIKLENYNNWTDGKVIFDTPISASVGITASSVSINNILTLTPQDPLPSSPAGTITVSASTPPKPYFYDGSTWNALY